MVDRIINNNRKYNRTICESFDVILKTILQQPDTPDECVDAIKYVESVNEKEIYNLKVRFFRSKIKVELNFKL